MTGAEELGFLFVATAEPKIFKNGSNVIKPVLCIDSLRTSLEEIEMEILTKEEILFQNFKVKYKI